MARRFSVLDSDSGDGDAHQGYSPEILPPSPRSSVRGNPCNSGALRRLSFEGVPLRDTINVTPPGPSSQNLSIGTRGKQTPKWKVTRSLKFMEERLENLEKVQTPLSSEGSSETQKWKVPAHVWVC